MRRPDSRDAQLGPFVAIAATAADQYGLLTSGQLRAAGLSTSAADRWLQLGRLERVWRGVYRLAGHPPTWRQNALGAVLAGPDGTILSHRAAAALHGFRGFRDGPIEVVSDRWRRARPHWLEVHESLRLDAIDRTVVAGIPTTTPIRTLIDLGAVTYPDKIGLALDEERRRGTIELDAVALRLEELAVQGRNGIRAVRALLEVRQGQALASTGFEQLLLDLVRSFGLPEPERQWKVVGRERLTVAAQIRSALGLRVLPATTAR